MNKKLLALLLTPFLLLSGCNDSSNDVTTNPTTTSDGEITNTNTNTSTSTSGSLTNSSGQTTLDKYTIMIYMCGSDLESGGSEGISNGGMATDNIKEILSVNLPSNVNIVIETGGAKKWTTTYGISAYKTQRYEVKNKKLNLVQSLSKANMGQTATLQSFVQWGLENYPAEKTGFIFWNHGGAMQGVCSDENYNYDSLTNSEVQLAFSNVFENLNRTEKLEWVGYDACLMQVQDIAEFNSTYFNYMVASQESEPGEGWDYDVWLNKLASNVNIDTKSLLSSVADSFINKCKETYNSYDEEYKGYNDGTMSVLDLSKMNAYKNNFETVAKNLSSSITTKTKFKTLMKKCNQFGYYAESDYNGYYAFDVFDVGDFIKAVSTSYSDIDTTSLKESLNNLVVYNVYGKDNYPSGKRTTISGLCMFAAVNGVSAKSDYSLSQTNFEEWRLLNNNVETWYPSY